MELMASTAPLITEERRALFIPTDDSGTYSKGLEALEAG